VKHELIKAAFSCSLDNYRRDISPTQNNFGHLLLNYATT